MSNIVKNYRGSLAQGRKAWQGMPVKEEDLS